MHLTSHMMAQSVAPILLRRPESLRLYEPVPAMLLMQGRHITQASAPVAPTPGAVEDATRDRGDGDGLGICGADLRCARRSGGAGCECRRETPSCFAVNFPPRLQYR